MFFLLPFFNYTFDLRNFVRFFFLNETPLFDAQPSAECIYCIKNTNKEMMLSHKHTHTLFSMCHNFTLDHVVADFVVVAIFHRFVIKKKCI